MALELQPIHFLARQQTPGKCHLKFWTMTVIGSDAETLLGTPWEFDTDETGEKTFSLPVKTEGTIKWHYEVTPSYPGRITTGFINVALDSGTLEFDDLVGPGAQQATDSVQDFVNQQIAAQKVAPKAYAALWFQQGTDAPSDVSPLPQFPFIIKEDFSVAFERVDVGVYQVSSSLWVGPKPQIVMTMWDVWTADGNMILFPSHSQPSGDENQWFIQFSIWGLNTPAPPAENFVAASDNWTASVSILVWPNGDGEAPPE